MSEPVTKGQLLDQLNEDRQAWDTLLSQIPRERMTETGVVADWSVKDIVAHVAAWERWASAHIASIASGEPAIQRDQDGQELPDEVKSLDLDGFNRWLYNHNRSRPLDEVLMDEQQVYRRLVTYLRGAREDDLMTPGRFEWSGEHAAWQHVAGNTYEHWAEHADTIRTWLTGEHA